MTWHRKLTAMTLLGWLAAFACGDAQDGLADRNSQNPDAGDGGVTTNDGGLVTDGGSIGVGMPCSAENPCPDPNLVCAQGVCQMPTGTCTSDADCLGDTFCCLADCAADPAQAGTCIPNSGQNPQCRGDIAAGVFSPSVQCEWTAPPAGDPYATKKFVLTTPMVANLPHDSGAASEIVIVTTHDTGGGRGYDGVIRVLNGQTCQQLEVIADSVGARSAAPPAIADLDGDGVPEIVARFQQDTVRAFHWDAAQKKYVQRWAGGSRNCNIQGNDWAGFSIHDLDNDGKPEIITACGAVFSGQDGTRLNPNQALTLPSDPAIGDLDADGQADIIAGAVYSWHTGSRTWRQTHDAAAGTPAIFFAYADFGTPGASFNSKALDGIAEVVASGGNMVGIYTLDGQEVLRVSTLSAGGPPTIGDFDNDGFPEVAVADGTFFRVFDIDCQGAGAGCAGDFVRWEQPSQDSTSKETGSTTFDFEGNGAAEAIYADECFLRVYDGASGDVLYSAFRNSCTWWENPTVADVDGDTRTEIVVNSNPNCATRCPAGGDGQPLIDPIHDGVRCLTPDDCYSKQCDAGFCRCSTNADCGEPFPDQPGGLKCVAPRENTPGTGNVCRQEHPNPGIQSVRQELLSGVRVVRDRLDRWVSSRPMWNQHAYNITNINDDTTIPSTSTWPQNFLQTGLNNFRANVQGEGGTDDLPDITGALDKSNVCSISGTTVTLTAKVCNRGYRLVGADMPATFYLGPVEDNNILCVSYTNGPVPIGDECLPVSCELDGSIPNGSVITMVVNDDGKGGATTVECNTANNVDNVSIEACDVVR